MKVAISYLKSKYNLQETINKIKQTDAEYIHVDVMDNKFVPNKTYDYIELEDILKDSKKPLDVHLMVEEPLEYIEKYKNLNPIYITIHTEINKNIKDLINLIKSYNIKPGISIKPNTKVSEIIKYLDVVENVLIMSVEPGFGGQKFNEEAVTKINELIGLRNNNNYNYVISIDGGINNETIEKVKDVDFVISGSYICMSDNYQEQINNLKK